VVERGGGVAADFVAGVVALAAAHAGAEMANDNNMNIRIRSMFFLKIAQ
jgi:hypothetical protein